MSKMELVFIPTPSMGHLIPTIECAKRIILINPNISIFFIIPNLLTNQDTVVTSYIESESRKADPNQMTFVTLSPFSNPPDHSSPNFFENRLQLLKPLIKKAVQDRLFKCVAFVLDLMHVSLMDLGNDLNVPSYIFLTAGATLLNTVFHVQALADEKGIDYVAGLMDDPDAEIDLPGVGNRVPARVLPYGFLDKDSFEPAFVVNIGRRFREAKGILVNSFMDLEFSPIQSLQSQDMLPTIYPVGPIISLTNRGDKMKENDIVSWLDEQPKSSVVFLCFGGMGSFDAEQVREIAKGLDRSGYRFLWSLRKPTQVDRFGVTLSESETFEEVLPEGFLDRTARRGKIVSWAPQDTILGHQSIGGFISHCGWNSILESIWCQVPIGTWPMYAEHQLNAFSMVKELGLGVEISLDYRCDFMKQKRNYLITGDEVEVGVRKVMSIDEEKKAKLREMSDKSRKALQIDGGSSHYWLTRFIAQFE